MPEIANQLGVTVRGAGALMLKIQERRATLMGLNAPRRVHPIQLAEAAKPQLNSTQKIQAVVDRFLSEDKKRLINGGEGYTV